ncbi:MAG: tRNA glutamyl-Q(34) synthetase GluQRS [Casimicrobium sp.]
MNSESPSRYVGRFAPSPTGSLHFGSLVAALASYVDARSHNGTWLVRIEDVDTQRCSTKHEHTILRQLDAYGFVHDGEIVRQSDRSELYRDALDRLAKRGLTYRCRCTRKMLADAPRNAEGEIIYPGTCRDMKLAAGESPSAVRLNLSCCNCDEVVAFDDRAYGRVAQCVRDDVGDFVLHRADGDFAYQLAVVVDDAQQEITHVVRGADLLLNTPRQVVLQRALELPTPSYLHTPIATNANGEKLSKQTLAAALPETSDEKLALLRDAWRLLRQPEIESADSPHAFLRQAVAVWQPRALKVL